MSLNAAEVISRLAIATVLGTLLGLERQWRHRSAGLQTNSLVSLGSALFVMLSTLTPEDSSPTRIAAQVVSGIGFLAGGVILREGASVHGLNTAATLWCAAAVGAMTGSGHIPEACAGSGIVLAANLILRPLSHRINRQPMHQADIEIWYHCSITCERSSETHIRAQIVQWLSGNGLGLRSLVSHPGTDGQVAVEASVMARQRDDDSIERLISHLSLESNVFAASWHLSEQRYDP